MNASVLLRYIMKLIFLQYNMYYHYYKKRFSISTSYISVAMTHIIYECYNKTLVACTVNSVVVTNYHGIFKI